MLDVTNKLMNTSKFNEAINHLQKFCEVFDEPDRSEVYRTIIEEIMSKQVMMSIEPYNNQVCNDLNANSSRYCQEFSEIDVLVSNSAHEWVTAVNKIDQGVYAIKKIFVKTEYQQIELFAREAQLLSGLMHKNIIRYFTSWTEVNVSNEKNVNNAAFMDGSVGLVFYLQFELLTRTTILDLCKDSSFEGIFDYLLQFAEGLDYIHSLGVVHGNINPSCILAGIDGMIKICDFSLSFKEDNPLDLIYPPDCMYCSPEQKTKASVNKQTDIYSYGIIMKEILLKAHITTPNITSFVERLTQYSPLERPRSGELVVFLKMIKSSSKELISSNCIH